MDKKGSEKLLVSHRFVVADQKGDSVPLCNFTTTKDGLLLSWFVVLDEERLFDRIKRCSSLRVSIPSRLANLMDLEELNRHGEALGLSYVYAISHVEMYDLPIEVDVRDSASSIERVLITSYRLAERRLATVEDFKGLLWGR